MKKSTTTNTSAIPSAKPEGLVCPKCGCCHLPVIYTRLRRNYILRARQCRHCERRMFTREIP
ncbi:MAG: hypothetical protein FWD61_03880 [Phycisphaerales bacterium]|nr:hypothetical protein [Phycisphaerales bacterium]